MQKNWCKTFNSVFGGQIGIQRQDLPLNDMQSLTKLLLRQSQLSLILLLGKCIVVVDGSFFPDHLEYVSAY